MAATWATSSVRSSAASPKGRYLCQFPLDFVITRKRACPPKGYTYPVILKQQHKRENIVAFASICGPSNSLPASRHCERDSWAAACSGILFSLMNGCVLLERVSLNFASPGLSILDWTLHKRKRFAWILPRLKSRASRSFYGKRRSNIRYGNLSAKVSGWMPLPQEN